MSRVESLLSRSVSCRLVIPMESFSGEAAGTVLSTLGGEVAELGLPKVACFVLPLVGTGELAL